MIVQAVSLPERSLLLSCDRHLFFVSSHLTYQLDSMAPPAKRWPSREGELVDLASHGSFRLTWS